MTGYYLEKACLKILTSNNLILPTFNRFVSLRGIPASLRSRAGNFNLKKIWMEEMTILFQNQLKIFCISRL